jgi:hypothetical protein
MNFDKLVLEYFDESYFLVAFKNDKVVFSESMN